jgi:DNA-binding beta-propeller fold protein YncE
MGFHAELHNPIQIAFGPHGRAYILNYGDIGPVPSVSEYAAGANGDITPSEILKGDHTGMFWGQVNGFAVDSTGELFVSNEWLRTSPDINVPIVPGNLLLFPPLARGDQHPRSTITHGLEFPQTITTDDRGTKIFAANRDGSIVVYARNSDNSTYSLAQRIAPIEAQAPPTSIALGPDGRLYLLTGGLGNPSPNVAIFQADTSGNFHFTDRITNIGSDPEAITVDAAGQLYVVNTEGESGNSVSVYAAGAVGSAIPFAVIRGPHTGLDNPFGIAILPSPH